MRNLEQELPLQRTLRAHHPCITSDCIAHDKTRFATLRDQVDYYAFALNMHERAHQHQDVSAIQTTDKLFPPSLQGHQPEVKP